MLAASQSTISFAAKTRVSVLVRITAATTLILLGGCRSESDPPTSETSAVQPSLEPITIAEQEPKKEAEPPSREATLETADRLVQQNDFVGAVTSLRSLLVADPDDVEVIFRLLFITNSHIDAKG